jgi:hypothetical protein
MWNDIQLLVPDKGRKKTYRTAREGWCAIGLAYLMIGRSDGITISGDLLANHLPYFMCSMPVAVRTPTVLSSYMFASCEDVPRAR